MRFFLRLAFFLDALLVDGGWNKMRGAKSNIWRRMSVEEREAFVVEFEAKIDAAIGDMTPDALINEQNREVRLQAAQTRVKRLLQAAFKKLNSE